MKNFFPGYQNCDYKYTNFNNFSEMIFSWSFIMVYWRFFIEISPFTDFSKPDHRTSLWQNIKPSTHDWTSHWTTSYHKTTANQSTLETGEWPTEDVPSDYSTEPYKVGPIDMVQRLCIVMLPCVPSKVHQKLALHERVQLCKRWTIIYQPKLTKGHQVSEFLLLI